MHPLLEIKNLSTSFDTAEGKMEAVKDISFSLNHGETAALVGNRGPANP
jgi:ABC-type dipeptide/oligopeptide/nickel transport system ATPase component